MSNSIFTKSPFFNLIRLVSFKVWGITVTWKPPLVNLDIVKDTPLIEIEPFSTIYFLKSFLISKSIVQDLWTILIFLILDVVSTCPWT